MKRRKKLSVLPPPPKGYTAARWIEKLEGMLVKGAKGEVKNPTIRGLYRRWIKALKRAVPANGEWRMANGENNTAGRPMIVDRDTMVLDVRAEAAVAIERRADVVWDVAFKIKESLGKPGTAVRFIAPEEFGHLIADVMKILDVTDMDWTVELSKGQTRVEICWRGEALPARRVGEKR